MTLINVKVNWLSNYKYCYTDQIFKQIFVIIWCGNISIISFLMDDGSLNLLYRKEFYWPGKKIFVYVALYN